MIDTPISLLERLSERNTNEDWTALVALYRPLVTRWLSKLLRQSTDVDDVAQEALLQVCQLIPKFKHNGTMGAFRSWLRRIVVFKARQFWRAQARCATTVSMTDDDSMTALEVDGSVQAKQWDDEHDRHVIATMLEYIRPRCSEQSWAAFQLYVVEGWAPEAVAQHLGCSKNAVFIARSRILHRLRSEIRGLVATDEQS
jgi:RNA polymerase sigma-70 factor (ECF subfamily)